MSHQQPQTPYIGSKISLISRLDIRYEGVLHSVDSTTSTIALAKVRSFGTEERPTLRYVPPREEIYDFIIFKAQDIKDLIVCESPKPAPDQYGGLYDPAIVSVSHQIPIQSVNPVPDTYKRKSSTPTPVTDSDSRPTTPIIQHLQKQIPLQSQQFPAKEEPISSQRNERLTERKTDKLPSTGTDEGQGNNLQQQRRQYNQDRRHQYHQDQSARPARQNQNSAQNHQRPYSSVVGKNDYRSNQSRQYNPPNHRQYTNRYNGGYRQKNQARFETDFDFEKANEQFNGLGEDIDQKLSKIKISEKNAKGSASVVELPQPKKELAVSESKESTYDKKTSFFDNISCEALEKEDGVQTRPNWKKERATNQETFGSFAVRTLNNRRGGFRRGNGQRGFGRF